MRHFFRFLVSKVFLINILLVIILLGGGLYATLYYLNSYTLHDEVLVVPNLIGEHQEDIEDISVENDAFQFILNDSVFVEGKVGGTIIDQNPKADKTVKRGRKVYLTVASKLQPTANMPRLIDRSLRQATSLMETYGFKLGKLVYKPNDCENCVLEQLINDSPVAEGEKIRKGSVIDLVVGQGLSNELVDIPYIIDFSAEMAESLLNSRSLNVGAKIYDETCETAEDSAKALVYKQMPFFSKIPTVRMGSSVDIFLTIDTNKVVHSVNPTDTIK